ncbi:hypothetical protein PybrP1_000626, partial [[Pythium] brassicae (nom. inval.)]
NPVLEASHLRWLVQGYDQLEVRITSVEDGVSHAF